MRIYVDPADELNTIVHRVRLASQAHVELVLPKNCDVLRNPINLQLLAKYAKDWKKEITIHTSDPLIVQEAEAHGLKVYQVEEVRSATSEHSATEDSSTSHKRPKRKRGRERLVVILLIIAAFTGIAYLITPQVEVVITPAVNEFSESIRFRFTDLASVEAVDTSVNISRRTSATGRQTVGIARAEGVVVLLNQSQEEISVPQGTIVTTGNQVAFQTTVDVTVPPVSTEYFMDVPTGLRAGRAEVDVEAVELGTRANVSAGRISRIQEGMALEVRNPEPMRGGEDAVLTVVADEDVARAQERVERDARQLALEALRQKVGEGFLLEDSLRVQIEWDQISEVGQESDEVYATARIQASIYQVDSSQLAQEVVEALTAIQPEGFAVKTDSVKISQWTVDDDELVLAVEGIYLGEIDTQGLLTSLSGLSIDDALSLREQFPEIAQVTVNKEQGDHLPRWVRWIDLQIEEVY